MPQSQFAMGGFAPEQFAHRGPVILGELNPRYDIGLRVFPRVVSRAYQSVLAAGPFCKLKQPGCASFRCGAWISATFLLDHTIKILSQMWRGMSINYRFDSFTHLRTSSRLLISI